MIARVFHDKSKFRHAVPFALLLLAQIGLAFFRELPLVVADESVYLAHARYFSGSAPMPTLHGASFFAFGYSLFLVPAFWLFDSPYSIYTASLVVSALLMSTLYFSLYYVLASLLNISSRLAMLAAFITCLYPPLLLRANFAWAENAYVPGFMLLTALFGALVCHRSLRIALAFGFLLGFMYTIHARSLPLIPIALLYVTVLGLSRALPWRIVSIAFGACAAILVATRLGIDHLKLIVTSDILENPVRPVIAFLLSLQGLHDFVLKVNEQLLYLVHSTYGLFLVGLIVVLYSLWQRGREGLSQFLHDTSSASLAFGVLAWLGTFFLGAAWNSAFSDDVVSLKGRFIDGVSMLFLALALVGVIQGLQVWSWQRRTVLLLLLAGSTVAAIYSLSVFPTTLFAPHSLGIYLTIDILGPTTLALIASSLAAAGGFVFFSLARGRWRFVAVAAIACLFLLTSAFGYFFAILPLQERVARSSTLAAYIRTYLGSPPTIAYDTTYYHPLSYFTYEFLLPHTRFIPFDGAAGELPPADIVISGSRWQEAETFGAQFWQVEPAITTVGAKQALWTLPGPQQSDLLQQVDYTNTVLGVATLPAWGIDTPQGRPVQTVWAVWQRSFYHPEITTIETSLVWFDADATLRIPYGSRPPQAILLNFINPAGEEKPLQIDVNGESIFAGAIPPGNWCEAFPLSVGDGGSVNVELSRPTRELLLVRGITLLDHVPDMQLRDITTNPLPASGYRSQLALQEPLYPSTLVRGIMGTVRISVTNSSDQTWPTSCEIGNSLGVVQLGILWFPKHSTDRTLSARVAEGRVALPYALAPGSGITLTAILAPIKQNGDLLPPGEYEVWIGPVQEGVTWFFQEGDAVIKLTVPIVHY